MGVACEDGAGTKLRLKNAVLFYSESASMDHGPAWYRLGQCYKAGSGMEMDTKKAHRCRVEAAYCGYAPAQLK